MGEDPLGTDDCQNKQLYKYSDKIMQRKAVSCVPKQSRGSRESQGCSAGRSAGMGQQDLAIVETIFPETEASSLSP